MGDTIPALPSDGNDPLGLKGLKAVVDRMTELAREDGDRAATSRFSHLVDQLQDTYRDIFEKYGLLKDRYALLKRSNAALCDELLWLRDQLDDLTPGDEP